ncbi:extensin-like [Gastrolobium bilobum]|uniref:extensin-like n=1 Tax=Gastrolobium bilobum TaxID=150636 RepID=UPI002AB036C3|nr:extensin-like [Gastrolobium bilobum]
MPANRGQGQPTRWYQLCFVPTNADSSDDSDTESVVLAPNTPTPTSTWQVSPSETPSPPRPPNPEPQIDWHFPPPPPPPPPLYLDTTDEAFGSESQDDIYETPRPGYAFLDHNNTPTPTSTWQVYPSETPSPPRPPNPEPQIDWHFPPPPPPPPPLYLDTTDEAFGSESQDDIYETPRPGDAFLDHNNTPTPTSTWQVYPSETPSPPRPPNPEPQIDWHFPPPPPPPLYLDTTDEAFGSESQDDIYETPRPGYAFLDHNNTQTPTSTWQVYPSETPLYLDATDEAFGSESQDDIYETPRPSDAFLDHNPQGPSSLIEQGWPETDKRNYPQVPDGIINSILRVRISEYDRDKLSLCPICMEELKVGYQACKLPCNHTYCSDCILLWLNNNKTCPLCRVRLDGGEGQGGSYSRGNNSLEP